MFATFDQPSIEVFRIVSYCFLTGIPVVLGPGIRDEAGRWLTASFSSISCNETGLKSCVTLCLLLFVKSSRLLMVCLETPLVGFAIGGGCLGVVRSSRRFCLVVDLGGCCF